jgi:hypothetical protein
MSKLRQHLRQAAAEYRDASYPGDLAAEILPGRGASLRWMLRAVLGGMLAAVLAVTLTNRAADPEQTTPFKAGRTAHAHIGAAPTPIVYNLPRQMPVALPFFPAAPPVLVSLPPETFNRFQQSYEEFLNPRLLDPFNRRRAAPARPFDHTPSPAAPATQEAVG